MPQYVHEYSGLGPYSVLFTFSLLDEKYAAVAVHVGRFEVEDFTPSQAASIDQALHPVFKFFTFPGITSVRGGSSG